MLIPDGYAQANWKFSGSAVPTGAEVTCGFDLGSFTGSPADAAAIFISAWTNYLSPLQVVSCDLASVLVKYGPNLTGPSAEVASGFSGIVITDGFVPSVSVLVQKNTDLGGRAGRGRFFVPGIPENQFDESGLMSPLNAQTWQDNLDDFFAAVDVGDFSPVLLHGVTSPIATPTTVRSFTVSTRAATQRRRLRR